MTACIDAHSNCIFRALRNTSLSAVLLAPLLLLLTACTTQQAQQPSNFNKAYIDVAERYSQDAFDYVDVIPSLDEPQRQELTNQFLLDYFAPWNEQEVEKKRAGLTQYVSSTLTKFRNKPGWSDYRRPHDDSWIEKIEANIEWSGKLEQPQSAIAIRDTQLRVLPTHQSSFLSWKQAGEGYPFDYMQQSFIPAFVPLAILYTTVENDWHLVISRFGHGWISALDIAAADQQFVQQWQNNNYLVMKREDTTIADKHGNFVANPRFGVLYPENPEQAETSNDSSLIHIAFSRSGKASIGSARLSLAHSAYFPIAANSREMALAMNALLGNPYGWGGIKGFRDCSSIHQDYFSSFGIALPRYSGDQIRQGRRIKLDGLDQREKERTIIRVGKPFRTLLRLPGHMMLYIGEVDGHAYVMHTLWGLRTRTETGEGRRIVGKAVITPLRFGHLQKDVYYSLLERTSEMAILF